MPDMTSDRTQHPPSKSDREAIDWFVRLQETVSESQDALVCQKIKGDIVLWAGRSAANLHSFLETASVFAALGECEAELIDELRAHIDDRQRTAPRPSPSQVVPPKQSTKRRWMLGAAVAASLTLVVSVSPLFGYWTNGVTYRTQAGEWRRVHLADGSVVLLREETQIQVSFSSTSRKISLLRGHALFDVAQDARRPLSVRSKVAEIQVLGTRFDVDDQAGRTSVVVVDGSVRVRRTLDDSLDHALTLTKGQGAQVTGRTVVNSTRSEVETVIGSQGNEILFHNQRLSSVAARLNLDSRRQLRIGDNASGKKVINGIYRTDDPEGLVLAIRDLYPDLEVRETQDGWVVMQR